MTVRGALEPLRAGVLVLAYHAIAAWDDEPELAAYAVPPDEFAWQLDALARSRYRFVGLDHVLEVVAGEGRSGRSVLVTFDDGYESLLTSALPLLVAKRVPAVVFAVAGLLGGSNEWDRPRSPARLLDAHGLAELGRHGVEVGSHSLTHADLAGAGDDRLAAEIGESSARLEAAGAGRPRAFAYPHGISDHAAATAVAAAGYEVAFTTVSGVVNAASDRYRLPRVEVRRGDVGRRFALRVASARMRAAGQELTHRR